MKIRQLLWGIPVFLFGCSGNVPLDHKEIKPEPMADIHLHFNWNQEELVAAEQAYQILLEQNIVLAVVFSIPSDNALKLSKLDRQRIIPFFSPYITGYSRDTWFRDPEVLRLAREGLKNKTYAGIGELHVVPGIGPRRDNKIFQGLLKLAAEYDVPFNIHTEAASYKFLEPICKEHSKVRFLWAHAGGLLEPEHSEGIIKACPNVWIELSAKDPKHYSGLVDENSRLRKEWKDVITRYPDRFMVGTDPVWKAHQANRWYEADEGWLHYSLFADFHRAWMKELPAEIEQKVRLDNAVRFFKK
jgi:predicted TIM-barrel fold metal-dependent hydrolase